MTGTTARSRAMASTRRLAWITAVSLLVLLVLALVGGWMAAGRDGALSAATGVALTAVLIGGGLIGLARTSGGSGSLGPVAAAFVVRFVLYALALALVTRAEWVHGPSLAMATAASIVVMLAIEMVAISREPVAELEPPPSPGHGGAGETTT